MGVCRVCGMCAVPLLGTRGVPGDDFKRVGVKGMLFSSLALRLTVIAKRDQFMKCTHVQAGAWCRAQRFHRNCL